MMLVFAIDVALLPCCRTAELLMNSHISFNRGLHAPEDPSQLASLAPKQWSHNKSDLQQGKVCIMDFCSVTCMLAKQLQVHLLQSNMVQ